MAKYLVTGAAGFIGSHMVETILEQGDSVVAFDNLEHGTLDNLTFTEEAAKQGQYTFIKGDIRTLEDCHKACEGVDYVLHQAALGSVPRSMEEPLLYHTNNGTGTLNMLIAARDAGVKRFCFASSSSVYGDTVQLPKVETITPTPKSPYAISKLMGEHYCKMFNESYGLETVAFRYFNVFGSRQDPNSQYAAVIPAFLTKYLANESPVIHGDGEQTRDFTYVKNVVALNLKACFAPKEACGRVYNVGCGSRISVNRLAESIKVSAGATVDPIYTDSRAGDVRDSLASMELAKKYLAPEAFVTLEEGMVPTANWYKANFLP
ncbi:SDR family oxidoreductase [bacterium]|jgi:nucleoside-diphosphate-sugar epimerase|nr:SDR family oxidoreductase [bacterium]